MPAPRKSPWVSVTQILFYAYFNLGFARGGMDADGDTIDTTASRYVSGYLATLCLSELSARYLYDGESSVNTVMAFPWQMQTCCATV